MTKQNTPEIHVSSYFSPVDGVCVVHIDTPKITEDGKGPVIRIYLNDYPIEENPSFPQAESHELLPTAHQDIERLLSQLDVKGTYYQNEWHTITRGKGYIPTGFWPDALRLLEDLKQNAWEEEELEAADELEINEDPDRI